MRAKWSGEYAQHNRKASVRTVGTVAMIMVGIAVQGRHVCRHCNREWRSICSSAGTSTAHQREQRELK